MSNDDYRTDGSLGSLQHLWTSFCMHRNRFSPVAGAIWRGAHVETMDVGALQDYTRV